MTLLMWESFDYYDSAMHSAKGLVPGGNASTPNFPRSGLAFNLWSAANGSLQYNLQAADQHATVIVGGSYYNGSLATVTETILEFGADVIHGTLRSINGKLSVYRGNSVTLLGQEAGATFGVNGIRRYLEVKFVLSDTVGIWEIRVDGSPTPVLTLTAQDTKNAGTGAVLTYVRWPGTAGNDRVVLDDIFVANGAGAVDNDIGFGECQVVSLVPNANGTTSQLLGSDGNSVDNYVHIDDTSAAAGTADYVGSATDDQLDTYNLPNLVSTTGTVLGAEIYANAQKTDAAARSMALVARTGGVDNAGPDAVLSASYAGYLRLMTVNPQTGVRWTIADINALEIGAKVRP